jgi:hypothetical protein
VVYLLLINRELQKETKRSMFDVKMMIFRTCFVGAASKKASKQQ